MIEDENSDQLFMGVTTHNTCRVEAGIMRQVVLWDTACNFNAVILNQSIFNRLITRLVHLLNYNIMIIYLNC